MRRRQAWVEVFVSRSDTEVLHLRWEEVGELSGDRAIARLGVSKTGPPTLRPRTEAVDVLATLRRKEGACFPRRTHRGTSLHVLGRGPKETGLHGVRLNDAKPYLHLAGCHMSKRLQRRCGGLVN